MNTDNSALSALLIQGRFSFLRLADCLLSADAAVAGWNAETMAQASDFHNRGCRIVLEISADESKAAVVALVAVSPGGERHELGRVPESSPGRAN